MSEYRVNQRRNWKGQAFPYDHYIPDETQECNYCLTEKQAEILRGIVEPLAWDTRWWSDLGIPIDKDKIESFRDDIVRRLIMSCCGDDGLLFQYSDSGILQQSSDGGLTWEDVPQKDPRNNSPRFPPMSGADGSDKKCLAATGATALIKEQIGDQLTDDMSRYTLNQLITDWVHTMITTSNPFTSLVTVIANQIFALIIATLRPALTDTVYTLFKCILKCRMEDDATFTETGWNNVRSDISDQIGGIAGVFLEHIVYLLGVGGMTNLVRAGGAATGDCSDCDPCDGECPIEWTFGNCTVENPEPDKYILTATGGHVNFTSGNNMQGCYLHFVRGGTDYNFWLLGDDTPDGNVDTDVNQVWNGDWVGSVGTEYTLIFSSNPFV